MVLGTAMQTYGEKLSDQQELLTLAADIITDVFAGESVVLRAMRMPAHQSALGIAAAEVYVVGRGRPVEIAARSALAAMADGDTLRTLLAALRRLLKPAPVNTVVAAAPDRRCHHRAQGLSLRVMLFLLCAGALRSAAFTRARDGETSPSPRRRRAPALPASSARADGSHVVLLVKVCRRFTDRDNDRLHRQRGAVRRQHQRVAGDRKTSSCSDRRTRRFRRTSARRFHRSSYFPVEPEYRVPASLTVERSDDVIEIPDVARRTPAAQSGRAACHSRSKGSCSR